MSNKRVHLRKCPLLDKYFVHTYSKGELADLICDNYCPMVDYCYHDLGSIKDVEALERLSKKRLEEVAVGCPKCQAGRQIMYEIKQGNRVSGLRKNEDGDWACFYCGFIIHKLPPLKYLSRGPKTKEKE